MRHYKVALTQGDTQRGTINCLQRLNQVYKTLIKRRIFNDSDEIEIRLLLLNSLNILEYIWWLLNSDL